MKRPWIGWWLLGLLLSARSILAADVIRLPLSDAIGSATAAYVTDHLAAAERDSAELVVIELDTPGGLDSSMRQIVKAISASSVPVAVYVSPSGARAASAGLFITLAAPIAAMAPGTSIGAAHPVSVGGGSPDSVMAKKVTNDAAAYARSLANRYHRNARWAELAVRESRSLSAEDALRDSVIDLLANDVAALLLAVDGRRVETTAGTRVLRTADARVRTVAMGWRERLLAYLSNPNLAYLLFMAGLLGITLELYHPGAVLPGVVGGIALILAFYAFQNLPVRAAGVLLLVLAIVLFLLEVKVTSYGVLSLGGATSLLLGSLMFFESGSAFRVSLAVLLPAVIALTLFFLFAVTMAARAQRRPALTGAEGMVGEVGRAISDLTPEGRVDVHGEYWRARAASPVAMGTAVRVLRAHGLELEVEPLPADPPRR